MAWLPDLVKQETLRMDPYARIVLFGSRARKEAKKESDWDFLILSEKADSTHWKSLIRDKLYELELETDEVITSLIHTPTHWHQLTVTPLYQIILKEGVSV